MTQGQHLREDRSAAIDAIAERREKEEFGEPAREGDGELERQMQADERSTLADRAQPADARLEQASRNLAASERHLVDAVASAHAAAEAERQRMTTELRERLEDHSNALYDGDAQRAALVMADIIAEGRQTASPAGVKVLSAAVKHDLAMDDALHAFADRFPEIVREAALARVADQFFDAALATGSNEAEALTIAGERTRALVKDSAKALGMREGGAGRRKPTSRDNEPDDASSVIAEMARGRPAAIVAAFRERDLND